MRLSKNFTLQELIYSDTAAKSHIRNIPNSNEIKNLGSLVQNVLQPLRDKLDKPILVTSGYRNKVLNQKLGGASNSQHLYGQAADIVCTSMKAEELYEFIKKSGLIFDQLILEKVGNTKWVHISYCNKLNRKQCLIYKNKKYVIDK